MKATTILLSKFIDVLKSVRTGTNGYADAQKTLPIVKGMLERFGDIEIPLEGLTKTIQRQKISK